MRELSVIPGTAWILSKRLRSHLSSVGGEGFLLVGR